MNNEDLLLAVKLVEEFSTALNSTSWVWGGMSMDIYQSHILREHDDLDYLTLNLHELVDPMTSLFHNAGWHSRKLENGDIKLEKNGSKIQLGHVEVLREVRWTHNGEIGSLFFPAEWLDKCPKRFCNIGVHVVAPELQYALLDHPELLNRDWKPREKDIAAKAFLRQMLESSGIILGDLHPKIHT